MGIINSRATVSLSNFLFHKLSVKMKDDFLHLYPSAKVNITKSKKKTTAKISSAKNSNIGFHPQKLVQQNLIRYRLMFLGYIFVENTNELAEA